MSIASNLNIDVPLQLDDATKVLIKRSYANAIKAITEAEILYIKNTLHKKVQILEGSCEGWINTLSKYFLKIYTVLIENEKSKILESQNSIDALTAALFYFTNPYDIIPDYTEDIGYIDDYYVLILCLETITPVDLETVLHHIKI